MLGILANPSRTYCHLPTRLEYCEGFSIAAILAVLAILAISPSAPLRLGEPIRIEFSRVQEWALV